MARGSRGPSMETLRAQYDHSYDHRGDSGMFGSFFTESVDEWTPADGENEIGIVPYLITENSIFRKSNPDFNVPIADEVLRAKNGWVYKLTVLTHGNMGPNKDRVICPRTLKLACPVCELRDELRNEFAKLKSQNRFNEDLEKRVQQLGASKRAIYNIISFNSKKDRDRGVIVWVAPHASIQDVIAARCKDKTTGEYKYFSVLEENWNVSFTKTGKGLSTEYSEVDLLDRRKEDRLTSDEVDQLLDAAWVLDDIVEIKSYDELYELLHGVKGGGEGTDTGERRREPSPEDEESRARGSSRRGRDEEEPPLRGERGRGSRNDEEPEPRERPRSRGGEDRGRGERVVEGDPSEDKERERRGGGGGGRASAADEPKGEAGRPECFALEFNQKQECEECASDLFKTCMKASDEAARKGTGRAAERGSEDRATSGGGGRSNRSSRK